MATWIEDYNGLNYVNYMFSTNNINSVNVGDNDKRFCIITCNNKKTNDKQYFLKFDKEVVNNEEAVRCLYEYLKTFPIEAYVPDRLFQLHSPIDDILYQDLKEYNREIELKFIQSFVRNIYGKEEHKVPCIHGVENCGVKRRMDSIPSYISHLYMEWRTVE